MSFRCREKYRLELHWDSIEHKSGSSALLKGAYFSGPVLGISAEIQAPDSIQLDLTPQHLVLLDSYYILKFEWSGVEYKDNKVILKGARLSNPYLKDFHKLNNTDYLVINTEKHEEDTHAYHLVYETRVCRKEGDIYNYEA